MPQGLQVWDSAGNLTLDVTNRLTKIIGRIITTPNGSGAVTVPSDIGGSVWFSCQPNYKRILSQPYPPNVTISDRTITWSGGQQAIVIEYGVY